MPRYNNLTPSPHDNFMNLLTIPEVSNTAGDFCRRFEEGDIDRLREVFNETRLKVSVATVAAEFNRGAE